MQKISPADRSLLRGLAQRVAEIAALPIQQERRALWIAHNELRPVRPLIYISPEGSWREILPSSVLQAADPSLHGIEYGLRMRIHQHEHLLDDVVIEKQWKVHKAISDTGWGLQAQHRNSDSPTGAWSFDPVLKTAADLKKLKFPDIVVDEDESRRRLDLALDLFHDILDVHLVGVDHISFHLMNQFTGLHGLMETMMDMIQEPGLVHDGIRFLMEGHQHRVRQLIDLNLLSLNNDGTYHSSGGFGYTTQLPPRGYDPHHIMPRDMWSSAESQELSEVSPDMHYEFATQYENQLLKDFALNGYGCCEDLSGKLDFVTKMPNMRRISMSPFVKNLGACAEKLQNRFIFSWKPQPAHLVGVFHEDLIRKTIRDGLAATRGCVLEILLKDTHTCENHPERFTRWSQITREEINAAYATA